MLKKQLPPDAPLARRTLLKGATLGVGADLVHPHRHLLWYAMRNFLAAPAAVDERLGELKPQNQRAPGVARGSSRQLGDPDPDRSSYQ
jgi:hypothetical protein